MKPLVQNKLNKGMAFILRALLCSRHRHHQNCSASGEVGKLTAQVAKQAAEIQKLKDENSSLKVLCQTASLALPLIECSVQSQMASGEGELAEKKSIIENALRECDAATAAAAAAEARAAEAQQRCERSGEPSRAVRPRRASQFAQIAQSSNSARWRANCASYAAPWRTHLLAPQAERVSCRRW